VTNSKGKQDLRSYFAKHRRDVLERISLTVQEVASAISKAMNLLGRANEHTGDERLKFLEEARSHHARINELMNVARGLAALIGSKKLDDDIASFNAGCHEIWDITFYAPEMLDRANAVVGEMNAAHSRLSDTISNEFRQIAA